MRRTSAVTYRILNAQGPDVPGGDYSDVAHGRMIGGCVLVAWPAAWVELGNYDA